MNFVVFKVTEIKLPFKNVNRWKINEVTLFAQSVLPDVFNISQGTCVIFSITYLLLILNLLNNWNTKRRYKFKSIRYIIICYLHQLVKIFPRELYQIISFLKPNIFVNILFQFPVLLSLYLQCEFLSDNLRPVNWKKKKMF